MTHTFTLILKHRRKTFKSCGGPDRGLLLGFTFGHMFLDHRVFVRHPNAYQFFFHTALGVTSGEGSAASEWSDRDTVRPAAAP